MRPKGILTEIVGCCYSDSALFLDREVDLCEPFVRLSVFLNIIFLKGYGLKKMMGGKFFDASPPFSESLLWLKHIAWLL